jgi:DNA invertase Pin-like site-specific DNA recombinase
MATIVGYVRVSTEDQAREGVSLAAQEEKIRAWWALSGEGRPLVVYRDEGLSGARMDRPGLAQALAACTRGGALVTYSMSRLARSTRGTLEVAESLERRGCDLVSLTEKIDTSSATGRMVFRLLAVLGEFEREQIAERVKMAMAYKRARGERISRWGRVPNAAVARARELRAEGLSLRRVGAALLAEGIRPVAGGDVWSPKVVRAMLARAA